MIPDTDFNRIVFLDRDGVINADSPEFIKSWAEFDFLPRSLDALAHLHSAGYRTIIVTNQSGIHRGLFTLGQLAHMHANLVRRVQSHGGLITDIFFCPHTPKERCDCRKPRTGLIRQAVQKYGLAVKQSVMVGDSVRDIQCARNAGCGCRILVQTGNGMAAQNELKLLNISVDHVARDLYDAVQWIITPQKT